jgi:hypothetical protein
MSDPRPPWWLKPMNKLNMAVQKLGIPTGPIMVLRVPGADWAHNARAAGIGTLSRGRKSRAVKIIGLETDDARPVLRAFPNEVPVGVGFYKRSGLVRHGTPDEFEALAGRCPVFRLDPTQ